MAIVKAPLLSLGASGQLGKTLVGTSWKGLKVMREYVKPANPRTADQVTQRNLFTDSVAAWRNYIDAAIIRAAWDRSALVSGKPQSGFNAGMSSLIQILTGDPVASYAVLAAAAAGNIVDFDMENMDDGATGDEAGNFEVWVGDAAASLLKFEEVAIAAGVVQTSDLGDTDDIKFVELRKGGYSRSGIVKVTLIA